MAADTDIGQPAEGKVYCKKCGAWVVPVNGECPRCGYQFNKRSLTPYLIVVLIALLLILIRTAL